MKRLGIAIIIVLLASIGFSAEARKVKEKKPTPPSLFMRHFAWGVDVGSSIDVSGNDLSSIDISAYFGYKNSIIRTLGAGVDIRNSLGNSHTMIPVYAMIRTDFSTTPSLCFLESRIGHSFNTLNATTEENGLFFSFGVGFNLFTSSTVKSHIVLCYTYNELNPDNLLEYTRFKHNLSAMSIRIGVNF